MNEFEVYQLYNALKLHFSSDYDFFKYSGKTSVTVKSFEKRKDKYHFLKLSKKPDPKGILVANLSKDPSMWIGKICTKDGLHNYTEYVKIKESLFRSFQLDLKEFDHDFNENLILKEGETFPKLFKLYQRKKVSIYTMIIINKLCRIFDDWNKVVKEDFIFPEEIKKIMNFSPFITFDEYKYKQEIIKTFS